MPCCNKFSSNICNVGKDADFHLVTKDLITVVLQSYQLYTFWGL